MSTSNEWDLGEIGRRVDEGHPAMRIDSRIGEGMTTVKG